MDYPELLVGNPFVQTSEVHDGPDSTIPLQNCEVPGTRCLFLEVEQARWHPFLGGRRLNLQKIGNGEDLDKNGQGRFLQELYTIPSGYDGQDPLVRCYGHPDLEMW